MRLRAALSYTLVASASILRAIAAAGVTSPTQFINSTGLTDAIGWDPYSFFIHGKRVFIQSGEFHTWRLPSPSLWKDITQKAKAAGLNTLSFYVHWNLNNPKAGLIDMTGTNDLQPFFDAAKESGLWLIARPGPYIKWVLQAH